MFLKVVRASRNRRRYARSRCVMIGLPIVSSPLNSKDAAQELAGMWLIEWAEMEALFRATSSSAKLFITRRHDRYRPPFGKHPIRLPRSCMFAGTINPIVGGYSRIRPVPGESGR